MPLGRGLSPNSNGGNLGSPTQKWNNLYVSTIYADYIPGVTISTRNTSYAIGAIANDAALPSYYRLVCVQDGITGAQAPTYPTPLTAGTYIADGTVIWIVDNVLDGTPVGSVVFDAVLRPGYIRANGASYSTASQNYPRLIAYLQANSSLLAADAAAYAANVGLWLYVDGTDTLTAPNYIDRVMQGGASLASVEAGLPEISGESAILAAGVVTGTGAISTPLTSAAYQLVAGGGARNASLIFKASASNAIYGASTTVQPPAIELIPQVKY